MTKTLFALLRVFPMTEQRRKYLFDFGHIGGERFSVFLDENNTLSFELTDRDGDTHAIQCELDFSKDFFTLAAGFNIGDKDSKMEMSIDDEQVAYNCLSGPSRSTGGISPRPPPNNRTNGLMASIVFLVSLVNLTISKNFTATL